MDIIQMNICLSPSKVQVYMWTMQSLYGVCPPIIDKNHYLSDHPICMDFAQTLQTPCGLHVEYMGECKDLLRSRISNTGSWYFFVKNIVISDTQNLDVDSDLGDGPSPNGR